MDAATLYPEILRPYDARANPLPPPTQGICDNPVYTICINEFWWAHVSGQIARLLYRDAWEGTDEEIQDAIDSISKILDVGRPTMGCNGGCADIPLTRIEDGVYQESDDGGITWHDAPTHDPRNSIPRIPAYPAPDVTGAKCAYADSAVNHFKEGFIDLLEEGQTAEEIGSIITGIAAEVFGPITGPIGWLVPAFFAIATAIVAIGVAAVSLAFTTGFWNQLRCLIFNNMNDDGSFTNAQIDAIYAGIPGGAITTVVLHSWLAAIGATGMTNAARLAKGSTSTDCSCPCTDETVPFTTPSAYYDHFTYSPATCHYTLYSINDPSPSHHGQVIGFDFGTGCALVEIISMTGADPTGLEGWFPCGGDHEITGGSYGTPICLNYFYKQSGTTPFTMVIKTTPCP